MASKPRDYDGELRAILDAAAEQGIEDVEHEAAEQAKELGIDVSSRAESVRALFQTSLKAFKQRKLLAIESTYQHEQEERKARTYRLPKSAISRRSLLQNILKARPELNGYLTAQHREFSELKDNDVESFLKQLQDLGVDVGDDEES